MPWHQHTFRLPAFRRGFHLVTHLIEQEVSELSQINIGLAHIFIHHTSASLSLNENAPYYQYTYEGPDDMPAHIKASLLGSSVTIPITNGHFNLGTWQGVYLCEHRNHASG